MKLGGSKQLHVDADHTAETEMPPSQVQSASLALNPDNLKLCIEMFAYIPPDDGLNNGTGPR